MSSKLANARIRQNKLLNQPWISKDVYRPCRMANSSKQPDKQYGYRPEEKKERKKKACTPSCPYDTTLLSLCRKSTDAVLSSDPEVLNSSTVLPLDLFTSQRRTVVGRVLTADTHNGTPTPKRTKHWLQSLVTDVTRAAERQQEVEGKCSGNRHCRNAGSVPRGFFK